MGKTVVLTFGRSGHEPLETSIFTNAIVAAISHLALATFYDSDNLYIICNYNNGTVYNVLLSQFFKDYSNLALNSFKLLSA